MIALSWILVMAAIAALLVGLRQSGSLWPTISVGAAIAAGLFLVAGVLRRGEEPSPELSDAEEDHHLPDPERSQPSELAEPSDPPVAPTDRG